MKLFILFALVLMCGLASGQDRCPKGTRLFPGVATSSLVITSQCATPEQARRLREVFDENMCGESGFGFTTTDLATGKSTGWSTIGKWTNGHCKTVTECLVFGVSLKSVDMVRCNKLIDWAGDRSSLKRYAHTQQKPADAPKLLNPEASKRWTAIDQAEQDFIKQANQTLAQYEARKADILAGADLLDYPKCVTGADGIVACSKAPKPETAKTGQPK